MPQPTDLPELATVSQANAVQPVQSIRDNGYGTGAVPSGQNHTWLFNRIYQWCVYLKNLAGETFAWTAVHSFAAGISVLQSVGSVSSAITGTGSSNSQSRGVLGLTATDFGTAVEGRATSLVTGTGVAGSGITRGVLGTANQMPNSPVADGGPGGEFTGAPGAPVASTVSAGAGIVARGGIQFGSAGVHDAGPAIRGFGGAININSGAAVGPAVTKAGDGAVLRGGNVALDRPGTAGAGAILQGGDIPLDTSSRPGGAGLIVSGGLGGLRGPAIIARGGDVQLEDGTARIGYTSASFRQLVISALGVQHAIDPGAASLVVDGPLSSTARLGFANANGTSFGQLYGSFNLPLRAVVTGLRLGYTHSGSAVSNLRGTFGATRTVRGTTGWTSSTILSAASVPLAVASAAGDQNFAPAMTATIANRTSSATSAFNFYLNLSSDSTASFSLYWVEVTYDLFDIA